MLERVSSSNLAFNPLHVQLALLIPLADSSQHLLQLFPHAAYELSHIISQHLDELTCVCCIDLPLFLDQLHIGSDLAVQVSHLPLDVLQLLIHCLTGAQNELLQVFQQILHLIVRTSQFLNQELLLTGSSALGTRCLL